MAQSTISTELLRAIKTSHPTRPVDYRDPKVPGFVLRVRPTGVHTWRVQLPDRSWLSLGRTDEVSLTDAREAAQHCRARVRLGQVVAEPTVADTLSLADFLCDHYAPWMAATRGPRSGQVARIRSAFADLLDLSLADLTTARLERWRAERRYRRRTPGNVPRRIALPTVNRDLAALQSALQRAVEWGQLRTNPLRAVKRGTEDGSASIRFLSKEEERRLRDALDEREAVRRAARDSADEWRRARDCVERGSHGAYTDHLAPLVLLALNTGLRRGELFQLRWQDVSLPGRRVTVRGAGAKTGQTRHVPLNSEPSACLSAGSRRRPARGITCSWVRLPTSR